MAREKNTGDGWGKPLKGDMREKNGQRCVSFSGSHRRYQLHKNFSHLISSHFILEHLTWCACLYVCRSCDADFLNEAEIELDVSLASCLLLRLGLFVGLPLASSLFSPRDFISWQPLILSSALLPATYFRFHQSTNQSIVSSQNHGGDCLRGAQDGH